MWKWLLVAAACVFLAVAAALPSYLATAKPQVPVAALVRPRVVVLAPGLAQTMRDLGVGSLIVGRHAFDPWSDAALPVCGDQEGLDYEKLVSTNPTHIFLQWGKRELPETLQKLAAQRGWKVKNYPLLTLDEVMAASEDVHKQFSSWADYGIPIQPPGETMHEALTPPLTPAQAQAVGRLLILHTTTPARALGPGSYHHDLAQRIGATLAMESGSAYTSLDAEDIIRLAPDAILLIQPREVGAPTARPLSPEAMRRRLGTLTDLAVPAVKRGRISVIDEPTALLPGTGLATVAAQMRGILQGWAGAANR